MATVHHGSSKSHHPVEHPVHVPSGISANDQKWNFVSEHGQGVLASLNSSIVQAMGVVTHPNQIKPEKAHESTKADMKPAGRKSIDRPTAVNLLQEGVRQDVNAIEHAANALVHTVGSLEKKIEHAFEPTTKMLSAGFKEDYASLSKVFVHKDALVSDHH
mmetsp:Transcript_10133/g.16615  ORF Transcript_10133/g.16615 Transcript_10133/m.16615 type:complete len:160 (-) Transcript_10133:762-1241(-)|eukprot:CAMPEP_0184664650 /NCGR_PEP_ID=MMETSP0308-20130426/53799_1 /TAXON_ID=38269 /ORGANISM="Gloeochaete witrockiana, Strain SAG 46.84" /LENGTH=159 /DNA_ID=CAMNT_0027108187 /DNA_START=153 /DNA_END=632 /DNA_ORIENTATION=-